MTSAAHIPPYTNPSILPSQPQLYPDYCHVLSPTIGKWCPMRAVDVLSLQDVGVFCDGIRLFHYGNHPVKWVRITGVVVAVDEYFKRKVYTVDDSSGACIECTAVVAEEEEREKDNADGKQDGRMDGVDVSRHLEQLVVLKKTLEGEEKKKEKAMVGKKDAQKEEKGDNIAPSVFTPLISWDEVDVGSVVKVKGRVGSFRDQKRVEIVKVEVLGCTDMEVRCWNEVREFRREVLEKVWVVSAEENEKCKRKRERDLKRARRGERERERERERGRGRGKKGEVIELPLKTEPKATVRKLKPQPTSLVDRRREYDARDEVLRRQRHHKSTLLVNTAAAG